MLTRPGPDRAERIGQLASFPKIFPAGLEYNCPVHENWNIVHTGMLIPRCHQIYVCSDNCLRGVIMTAAEMGALDRISSVMPTEREVLLGRLEEVTIEGISDVIRRLPVRPRAVQVFLVCMHHLLAADEDYLYRELEKRFPDIDFLRCWMDPIMQKISLTPEQKQRRSMLGALKKQAAKDDSADGRRPGSGCAGECLTDGASAGNGFAKAGPAGNQPASCQAVSILGDNLRLPETSDLARILAKAGLSAWQVQDCETYDQYRRLGDGCLYLTRSALSVYGLKALAEREKKSFLYLPPVAMDDQIEAGLRTLCKAALRQKQDDWLQNFLYRERERTRAAFARTRARVGDGEIWLDYLAFPRPLSLARRLLEEGFRVTRVCLDAVSPEEEADFRILQKDHPDLLLQSTNHVVARQKSRLQISRPPEDTEGGTRVSGAAAGVQADTGGKILALGPKAAFFADTPYFVNWIEYDGNWGYDGLRKLAGAMEEAWSRPKDTRDLVVRKGLGLPSLVEKAGQAGKERQRLAEGE